MGLRGDRSVAHRTGREPGDDRLDGFDVDDVDRVGGTVEPQQSPQGAAVRRAAVDLGAVPRVHLGAAGACRVLQQEHRLRGEQMRFAVPPVPVDSTARRCRGVGARRVRHPVPLARLLGDVGDGGAADRRVHTQHVGVESDHVEGARPDVRRDRGDTALGHHLDHTVDQRGPVVADRGGGGDVSEPSVVRERRDDAVRHRRAHRVGPEPEERRDVVDLPRITAVDDQRHAGAPAGRGEMPVHRRQRQQRRYRHRGTVARLVGDDQDSVAGVHGPLGLVAQPGERPGEGSRGGAVRRERRRHLGRAQRRVACAEVAERLEVGGGRYRRVEGQSACRSWCRGEEVSLGAGEMALRRDDPFADRIERRIGDLGEHGGHVVEQESRSRGRHGGWDVGAHRPHRFPAGGRHGRQGLVEVLGGVSVQPPGPGIGALTAGFGVRSPGHERDPAAVEPAPVGVFGGERVEQFVRGNDAPRGAGSGFDDERSPGFEPALRDHIGRFRGEHPGFTGEDHGVVAGVPPPAGAQAVPVADGAEHRAVGEGQAGGTVPGLEQSGVEVVECPPLPSGTGVVLPGGRHHHHGGVRQCAAREMQEFEGLVERRRIGHVR